MADQLHALEHVLGKYGRPFGMGTDGASQFVHHLARPFLQVFTVGICTTGTLGGVVIGTDHYRLNLGAHYSEICARDSEDPKKFDETDGDDDNEDGDGDRTEHLLRNSV